MDEQVRRGYLWKITFKKTHAHEMDLFREYVDIVQDALERVHASHVAYVQRQLSEEPDESMHEAIDMFHAEEDEKLAVALPALSHSATIVSIFSFLEHEMFELCARLQKNAKHPIGVKDLSGSGIEQAANYLEKICGLTDLRKHQRWGEVCKLQKVRNVIVHRRGILKEPKPKNDLDQEIRRYAFEKGLLTDKLSTDLVITKEFCVEAIETLKSMLWIMIHQVPVADMAGEDPCLVKSK
jgi:hypothetical protein